MRLRAFLLAAAMLLPVSCDAMAGCSLAGTAEDVAQALMSPVPAAAVQTGSFGLKRDPVSGLVMVSTEVRWRVLPGSSVRAALSGTVLSVRETQTGYLIVLDHRDGLRSVYRGLGTGQVRAGTCVEQDAELGRANGREIAFSLMRNGQYLDPMSLISESSHQVRLRKLAE